MTPAWPLRSVASLAKYVNGYPFKPDDHEADGLPVIRIKQLNDPDAETDFFSGRVPERNLLRNGDLVFSWSGSLCVKEWNRGPAWLNQHLFRVIPLSGVDKGWLRWALEVALVEFESHMHGSAMTHITKPMMREVRLPLPPSDVQRRIANFLDDQVSSIDRMMDLRRREQQLLETRQRALLADLVSEHQADWVPLRRFLRPRQEPDRADLPVLSVYRDHGVIPKSSRTDNFNKTPEDLARYQRVASNDLVVNKMKAWSGSVAVSRFEGIVSPDYLVCEVLEGLDPRYLHLVLRSPRFVAEMGIRSRGIRPNQERLYWEDLGGIAVPVPSLEEQQQTVEAAATTMATVDSIRDVFGRVSDLLEEWKRSLITAAVTGEFDVSSASPRAADVTLSGAEGAG